DLPDNPDWAAHYEGDTEPGSSGSPVFNDQWELVALHHSGVPEMDQAGNFKDIDGGIWRPGDDPARLHWVANEGIRVSRLVDHLSAANVKDHEKELLTQMLNQANTLGANAIKVSPTESKKPADTNGGPSVNGGGSSTQVTTAGGAVTVTIPLQVTVSLGS